MYYFVCVTKTPLGKMVSFRVTPDELERLNRLTYKVRENYPAYNRSDILRELVGMEAPGVVSEILARMQDLEPKRKRVGTHGMKLIED
jgi:hypothetical protein